jgi:hypothetical protein
VVRSLKKFAFEDFLYDDSWLTLLRVRRRARQADHAFSADVGVPNRLVVFRVFQTLIVAFPAAIHARFKRIAHTPALAQPATAINFMQTFFSNRSARIVMIKFKIRDDATEPSAAATRCDQHIVAPERAEPRDIRDVPVGPVAGQCRLIEAMGR